MMKSEYDRSYQWNPPGGNFYPQHLKGRKNPSEPLMTHKRRVKLTEDNVIIGEPLSFQNDDNVKEDAFFVLGDKNKKFHPSVPYRNMKVFDKPLDKHVKSEEFMGKESTKRHGKHRREHEHDYIPKSNRKKPHRATSNLINEAVQTDTEFTKSANKSTMKGDKSTQITSNVSPQSPQRNTAPNLQEKPDIKLPVRPEPQSEYQTKYAWNDAIARQALAFDKAAENQSKLDTKLKIYSNFISEYQRQFRPYEFVSENRFKRMKPTLNSSFDDCQIQFVPAERVEMRPRRALTPPPPPPPPHAPTPAPQAQQPMRNTVSPQHTVNPQRLRFPHGKSKRFLTEYSANFDNKWQTLQAQLEKNLEEEEARQSMRQSKWYKEILELRRKAQEYRQRARGTHFSREHLGEIFCKTRRPDSEEREELEENNTGRMGQHGRFGGENDGDNRRRRGANENGSPVSRLSREDGARDNRGRREFNETFTRTAKDNRRRRSSSVEGTILTVNSDDSSDASTVVVEVDRQMNKRNKQNDRRSKKNNSFTINLGSRSVGSPNANERRHYRQYSHTAGKPSFDNSLLLDEEASHDTELKEDHHQQQQLRQSYNQHQAIMGKSGNARSPAERKYTLQRYFNDRNDGDGRHMDTIDYDAIGRRSWRGNDSSAMSTASSCTSAGTNTSRSLALETLERARRHRDDVLRSKS